MKNTFSWWWPGAPFASPVAILAGTIYVMPSSVYLNSNYFVDVAFALDASVATPSRGPKPIVPGPASGNQWILHNFAGLPAVTGNFTSRQFVEMPVLIKDATATNGKYAFDARDATAPFDPRIAMVNVAITNLVSSDAFGAGLVTQRALPGTAVFMSNVTIEPNWPSWVGYSTTNKDGIVLDSEPGEAYGEDVTIRNWNADAAIDNKTSKSQWVRLKTRGIGQSTLKLWQEGPHYLVDCSISNAGIVGRGALIEIAAVSGKVVTVYIYNSTFNGSTTVPANKVWFSGGGAVNFVYLTADPRTTGEMHPMFKAR